MASLLTHYKAHSCKICFDLLNMMSHHHHFEVLFPDVANICYFSVDVEVKLSAKNVVERGLITEVPKSKDILKEHKAYCDVEREVKHFAGPTLAYVTPVGYISDIRYIYIYIYVCVHI